MFVSDCIDAEGQVPLSLPVALGQETRVRQPGVEIRVLSHVFDSGLRLYDTRIRTTHNRKVTARSPHNRPFIGAHVCLRGATTLCIPGCKPSTATTAQGSFFRTIGDESLFEAEHAQHNLRVIGIAADLDVIGNWFGGHLPSSLRPFLHGRLQTHHAATVPVPAAHAAAAALADTTLHAPMRALMLEGAAMQMVAGFLQSLCRHEHATDGLRSHERRAALDVHALLRENLDASYTMTGLAEAVSLAPQRLQRAFRELFGGSVFETQRHLRMEQAMTLLRSTYLPVRIIAGQVGYASQESFRRAFHGHFGVNPSRVRSR